MQQFKQLHEFLIEHMLYISVLWAALFSSLFLGPIQGAGVDF